MGTLVSERAQTFMDMSPDRPKKRTTKKAKTTSDSMGKNPRVLALFDVDGTLTEPREVVPPETLTFLKALREKIAISVVGGPDLVKRKEQLSDSPNLFD